MDWRTKWQNAHDQAAFYRSEQNTKEYWDRVAKAENAGLAGEEHIRLLKEQGIVYQKIPYRYTYQAEGGKSIEIPFAYLIVRK
ncbi:MAG: hypothetical protein K6B69_10510 [Lachnospiraceae bacterium]|nr:hypothetical protein [Lachnospiraceae bacterium]